jgi:hypothetical protein
VDPTPVRERGRANEGLYSMHQGSSPTRFNEDPHTECVDKEEHMQPSDKFTPEHMTVTDECWLCGDDLEVGDLTTEVLLRKVIKTPTGAIDIVDVNDSNVMNRAHLKCTLVEINEEDQSIPGVNLDNVGAILGIQERERFKDTITIDPPGGPFG